MSRRETLINQQLTDDLVATNQGVVGSIPASRTRTCVLEQRVSSKRASPFFFVRSAARLLARLFLFLPRSHRLAPSFARPSAELGGGLGRRHRAQLDRGAPRLPSRLCRRTPLHLGHRGSQGRCARAGALARRVHTERGHGGTRRFRTARRWRGSGLPGRCRINRALSAPSRSSHSAAP